jgi:signal transduction histidine kinase
MQRIAELDFSAKTDIDRNDEIGTLAANINKVSESLDAALTELRVKNEQLQEDIEKERQLERMRQEFVSSASHELKTPIAIIRGYAEGLKMSIDEKDASSREYCDIIINEADKMNELVISMLEQSMYESGVLSAEKEVFDVKEYIESFLKSVEPIFKEKAITVRCLAEPCMVTGNKKQLTTVLSNIVLNACSHVKGENIIEITTQPQEGFVKVSVFNTGSFVAEKDKDSIFTSFYRADKAHSRKEGRFGLGLSIVKSIISKHGCDCGFENKENGVAFWYTIERESNEN